MRIPVPKNRLVAFTLLGGLLSGVLAVALATPALGVAPLGLAGQANATNSSGQAQSTSPTAGTAAATASVGAGGSLAVEEEGPINIGVTGSLTPGSAVTITATEDGDPVANALVSVNGHVIGRTDASGRLRVPVPEEEFEVRVEGEDAEGRLAVEWGGR